MNPDTPPSSIWQRLSPFLDVIGAVLIFGSWIASNALSEHALSQANTHQAVVDRVRQFRLYDDFARRISGIQSDLARTRSLLRVGDDLLQNAASKSAEANQVAVWFKQLSYAFYVTGTMIILFGRVKSALSDLANTANYCPRPRLLRRAMLTLSKVAVFGWLLTTQEYAIALRPDSPLRKPLNEALLRYRASDRWDEMVYRYLGE